MNRVGPEEIVERQREALAILMESSVGETRVPGMILTWNGKGERSHRRLDEVGSAGVPLAAIILELRKIVRGDGARCYAIAVPMNRQTRHGMDECVQLAACSLGSQALNSLAITRGQNGAIEEFKDLGRIEAAGFEPGGIFRTLLEPTILSFSRH